MATKTKRTITQKKYPLLPLIGLVVLVLVACGYGVIYRPNQDPKTPIPTNASRPGYVDGSAAVEQVSNFYRQYLANASKPDFQKFLIGAYGDKNLVFYNNYYQHGFNPITCSTDMPVGVVASLVSTGSVATVKALATYPDHTTATITAKVTLGDKLGIDSITCPGTKGNLPPGSTN